MKLHALYTSIRGENVKMPTLKDVHSSHYLCCCVSPIAETLDFSFREDGRSNFDTRFSAALQMCVALICTACRIDYMHSTLPTYVLYCAQLCDRTTVMVIRNICDLRHVVNMIADGLKMRGSFILLKWGGQLEIIAVLFLRECATQ